MGPIMRSITSRKPIFADPWPFLRGWCRSPVAVGWPLASSWWSAQLIAAAALRAARSTSGPVVELGAGTGPVTEALLQLGCPLDQLVVVERDGEMCGFLETRFPGLRVLQGDALRLRETLARGGVTSTCVTVCGLPMRVVPPDAAQRCYGDAFTLMPAGGAVIQYTYGLRSPLAPAALAALDLSATFVGREWRNLPPMGVWRYHKRAP